MAKSKTFYNKKHKQPKSQKKHGGNCGVNASNWVEQVVGNYPHSDQVGNSNIITQNVPAANASCMSGGSGPLTPGLIDTDVNTHVPNSLASAPILLKGGKPKRSHKRKGGNVLSELAVPVVLLVANQTFGKKTGKKYPMKQNRFSRRYRRGRR